jgi:UDPglucose 6-dehydrogenase
VENCCVIGYGVVGQATAGVLGIKKHFDVHEAKSNITLADAARCEVIFICLPSDVDKDGNYQLNDIINTIKQIEEYGSGAIYVIRSTVWPGFAIHLQRELQIDRVISNPEFLTEATAEKDAKYPPYVLVGGLEGRYLARIKAIWESRIKSGPVIVTDNTTAELAKLALNGFFSTKVIYANQIFDAAQAIGANYQTIQKILESHPFGPRNHFSVWFKGKRGVHGKCLPKDTKALGRYTNLELPQKVMELNEKYIYEKENQ